MFDKLIESNSVQADFKPRRKFFMVSSVVVGIMFLSAVVFSLYAQDLDLGTNTFEIVEMIAPVPTDAPEPEPPRPQQRQTDQQQSSELPNRQRLIANINQTQIIPDEISSKPFTGMTIPETGKYTHDPGRSDSNGVGSAGPETRGVVGGSSASEVVASDPVEAKVPPPVAKPQAPKAPVSIGVANGKAIHLPKPPYTAAAIAVRAEGEVTVQVTIDEMGKVISAKAVSGHPMLRAGSERAAWNARFTPTTLSKIPVKVTGVIVYRFSR